MSEALADFLRAAEAWACDGYALDVRYIARPSADGYVLLSGSIGLNPLKAERDLTFGIETENLYVGHRQEYPVTRDALLLRLRDAANGFLVIDGKCLAIPGNPPHLYHSELSNRDRWFSDLHLKTTGGAVGATSSILLAAMDNELRAATPPFDGLSDLIGWLSLDAAPLDGQAPNIVARVGPPVDLIIDACQLRSDEFRLVLHAHKSLDTSRVGLSVRALPGSGLSARVQISRQIHWGEVANNRREGVAVVTLNEADNALAVLMLGSATIRRQWFIDPSKARNQRLIAIQHFDADLRKVREALLHTSESRRFEQGVASLLFLLGFSPAVQIESDAPDLIVTTPGGGLAIVECTLKMADVAEKVGKLVDRRVSLAKQLSAAGSSTQPVAVLVCRLPRDQISAQDENIKAHRIVLVSNEGLADGLDRVRHPPDPDQVLGAVASALAESSPTP